MRRPCICMKQLSEPGGSHFICVLLTFLIGKAKGSGYMRSKVSTGFRLAADLGSQGVFGGNIKQEAELEKGPFLIQAGRSWGGRAIGQGACLIQNGGQGRGAGCTDICGSCLSGVHWSLFLSRAIPSLLLV